MLMKNAFTNKKAICFKPFTFFQNVFFIIYFRGYSFKNYTVHPTQNKTIKLLLYTLLLGINEFNKRGLKWFLNKIYTPEKDFNFWRNPPPCIETIPDKWTTKVNLELEKRFSDKSSSTRTTQGSSQDQYSRTRSDFIWINSICKITSMPLCFFYQSWISLPFILYFFFYSFKLLTVALSVSTYSLYSIKQKQKQFADLVIFFSCIFKFFKNLNFVYFWASINLPWNHVRSHTKVWPDQFSSFMFIGFKRTDRQDIIYIFIDDNVKYLKSILRKLQN